MTSIAVKYRPSVVKDKPGSVYYQIIHERKVSQLCTGYTLFPCEWDVTRSAIVVPRVGKRMELLLGLRGRIKMDVERLKRIDRMLAAKELAYTVNDIVEEYKRFENRYSLFEYLKALIAKLKVNGKYRTSETYAAALNSFRHFRKNKDLMLDCLTTDIIEEYEAWHKMRGNTPNTSSFYMRILRAAYNRAVDEDVIEDKKPFRRVYTGVEKTTKRALPLQRIKQIKRLDLSGMPMLDYARDMFLLSFYLRGMSLIDMAFLKKTDLKNGYVVYRRRKTGQQLTIGWTKEMQKLVDKYPANPTQYLLPILTNPASNERCAYRYVACKINRNMKKVAAMIGLQVPVTMYVARHSWASVAKAQGIPVSVISEGMGHDSEATTKIYLASLDTSVVDRANSLIISSL
ncbi:MAG: site-specific integrase [Firmicutes bacterium]|nr:site-specific integrase [Bacillota bacterium]MCM1401795.1 site-specific integrase [Bacteroides sp.]MCM1477668.1 site-specific integrase [Bacteroides sp.]